MKQKLNVSNINRNNIKLDINEIFIKENLENLFKSYVNNDKYSVEDLRKIKQEMESIQEIVEYMYQSPQAEEANDEGMISEFDSEEISYKITDQLGDFTMDSGDIVEIYDSYNGDFGIVIKNDEEIKKGISKFLNEAIKGKQDFDEDVYLELYNKKGEWCEIHISDNYEDENKGPVLYIDEIPANQKILETRDYSYSEFEITTKEDLKEKLYEYFEIK